jgi:hypothetical protein
MGCLGFEFIKTLLIWLIILGGVVALIKLLLPRILAALGVEGDIVIRALMIVLWVIIACFVVYFVFDVFSCLLGGLPRMR